MKRRPTWSSLIDQAVKNGEAFVIAKAGKPMVKVAPLTAADAGQVKRLRSLLGQFYGSQGFRRDGS